MPATQLPIDDFLPQICGCLAGPGNLVLVAEPGAGKSTRVAPAVAGQLAGRVLLLQPRRLAARAVAGRIAEESGTPVGGDFVGYQVRFDNRTSARTRIVVMTEGLLARIIQTDPFLEGISCVILDEFHERSIHTDLAIALLREIQQQVRPDLRIIVMSATLDAGPVAEFLGGAPLLQVPGRTFPLEISHAPRHDPRPLDARMADAIAAAAAGSAPAAAPHILAFLPGIGEIRRTHAALPAGLAPRVHVLHSSISAEDQDAALRPRRQQKIILATNIAETSLTIDGVGLVIDSGLARVPVHDNRLGLDRLETRRISKASARQRAGRAGRSAAGRAVRLFTAEEYSAMDDFDTPEILRLDLAHTVLTLLTYGTPDVRRFPWFQPPPDAAVQRAQHLLTLLGAVDGAGHLLEFGRQLAGLPLHPRLGAIYLHGAVAGHSKEAAWLCALLEDDDCRPTGPQHSGSLESDILDRLAEVLHRRGTPASWSAQNAARQLQRVAARDAHGPAGESSAALGQALLRGFPDRVCQRRAAADPRGLMVGRRGVELARESRVASAELFLAIELRDGDSAREALVTSASALRPEWLELHLPGLVRTEETVAIRSGKPRGIRRTWFQDLLLKEVETGQVPAGTDLSDILQATLIQQHGSARAAVLASGPAEEWLRRYAFIRSHMPEAGLPSPDFEQVLGAACSGANSAEQALANALACLKGLAPVGTEALLNENAPEYLPLPSGNRARVSYPPLADEGRGGELQSTGQPPSLAARVQELFGLAETPRLAGGRVPLLIELLSPARRPVQITADLRSFWNGAYQEVRKELRARYPKHPWPEDPWTAPAVSIGSRRRS